MLNDLITYVSIGLALWMAWRYLRRSARYVWERVIMSWQGSAGPVLPVERAGSEPIKTSSASLVLPQQNQIEPEPVRDFEQVAAYLRSHNLTDKQAIALLALMHRESGDLFSANKIRDIVGGADAAVKAQVVALRPKPPTPKPAPSIRRPQNGW